MDYEYLRQYMAREEQEQLDGLIAKAVYRKQRKNEAASRQKGFRYFRCQCMGMKKTGMEEGESGKEPWEEEYFDVGIERLLRDVCSFSLKHGLCQCAYHGEEGKWDRHADMADDELPL